MKLHRRILAMALALLTVLCLGLGGCTPQKQEPAPEAKEITTAESSVADWQEAITATEPISDPVYVPGIYTVDKPLEIFFNFRTSPNGIYVSTIKDRETWEQVVWEYDATGHFLREYPVARADYIDSDGSLWNLVGKETKGGTRESCWIDYTLTHTVDGETRELMQFRDDSGDTELLLIPGGFALHKCWWDEDNNGHFTLELYDGEAQLLKTLELDEWFINTVRDGEEQYFISTLTPDIYRLDPAAMTLVKVGERDEDCTNCTVAGGMIYESDDQRLYRKPLSGGVREELFRFRDIYGSGGLATPIGGTNAFLYVSYNSDFHPFTIVYPVERSSLPAEKRQIVLAVNLPPDEESWWPYGDYTAQIQEFNILSRDYEIVTKNYGGYPDPQAALNADIAVGNAPDLIDMSRANTNGVYSWDEETQQETFTPSFRGDMVRLGVCEDLLPYVERDLGADALLPGPLNAMLTNGKLLSLAPSFRVVAMIGPKALVEGQTPGSFAELSELAGGAESVFHAGVWRGDFLLYAFANSHREYTKEQVEDILRFGGCLNSNADPALKVQPFNGGDWDPSMDFLIDNGDIWFGSQRFDLCTVGNPGELMVGDAVSLGLEEGYFREPVSAVGFPGSGDLFLQPQGELVIPVNAANKEGAWAFLRFVLQDEYLLNLNRGGGFVTGIPITRSAYERGMAVYRQQATGSVRVCEQDLSYDVENVFAEYDRMVDQVSGVLRGGDELYQAVKGIAAAYYAGEKSLDAAAQEIFSKLQIYNSEHS